MKQTTVSLVLCRWSSILFLIAISVWPLSAYQVLIAAEVGTSGYQQDLTSLQLEIDKQKGRLNSAETEERRDAVMRLGALAHPDASRAVLPALADPSSIVRVAAAMAVFSLRGDEGVAVLIPLVNDIDPFVRQAVAYALGSTHNSKAVAPLVERLASDKDDGVRAAAAVALGMIRDEAAVVPLAQLFSPAGPTTRGSKKRKAKENEFVLRAAARSLGMIGSRAAVPTLIQALTNEAMADDVRREAAAGLGLIGDPSAVPALQAATSGGGDPHLLQIALESLRQIASARSKNPS